MNKFQKFQEDYGRYTNEPKERAKNYDDWNTDKRTEWQNKPIEEVESYYINLKGYVGNLKKNPRNGIKARALIHKKKAWRNGLLNILCADPNVDKHYRRSTLPLDKSVVKKSEAQKELEKERIRRQVDANRQKGDQDEEDEKFSLRCDEEMVDTQH